MYTPPFGSDQLSERIHRMSRMEAVAPESGNGKKRWGRIGCAIVNIAVLVLIALFLTQYAAYAVTMKGHSMEPSVPQDSQVLINRTVYCVAAPQRFDVVAFRAQDGAQLQLKRIVGLPGETVRIADGHVYIDGEELTEAEYYVQEITSAGIASEPITLGEDEYFVLGDNPSYSEDSRSRDIGTVKRSQIYGRAWFCFSSFLSFWLL